MIDWFGVFYNALWIFGLAIVLAALSYADWRRRLAVPKGVFSPGAGGAWLSGRLEPRLHPFLRRFGAGQRGVVADCSLGRARAVLCLEWTDMFTADDEDSPPGSTTDGFGIRRR